MGVRRARVAAAGWLLLAGIGLAACQGTAPERPQRPQQSATHVVRAGENLYRLSLYYEVPVARIRRANRIRNDAGLQVGARLRIPGTTKRQPGYALTPRSRSPRDVAARPPGRPSHPQFRWPITGRLSSRFGWRGGRPHEGIDIAARSGTRIRAAAPGRVILAGWLGGYGRVVIVRHRGDYSTVYAHTSRNHVRRGQRVKTGQLLAEVGATGRATGPHLHFELRRNEKPLNPLRYLP